MMPEQQARHAPIILLDHPEALQCKHTIKAANHKIQHRFYNHHEQQEYDDIIESHFWLRNIHSKLGIVCDSSWIRNKQPKIMTEWLIKLSCNPQRKKCTSQMQRTDIPTSMKSCHCKKQ